MMEAHILPNYEVELQNPNFSHQNSTPDFSSAISTSTLAPKLDVLIDITPSVSSNEEEISAFQSFSTLSSESLSSASLSSASLISASLLSASLSPASISSPPPQPLVQSQPLLSSSHLHHHPVLNCQSCFKSVDLDPMIHADFLYSERNPAHAQTNLLWQYFHSRESSEFDHPMCIECAQTMLTALERRMAETQSQHRTYISLLEQLDKQQSDPTRALEDLAREIEELQEEEARLLCEIQEVEAQRAATGRETALVMTESERIANIEEHYWETYNEYLRELHCFQEARDALRMESVAKDAQLQTLMKTNALNDSFHIWYDGHFGTINGLRLGRLPSQPVEWNEINAAWGEAAFLLYTMAGRLKFRFSTYRILPMGSFSKIERIDNGARFDLYDNSDTSLGRWLGSRRFDSAMIGYLHCLKDLGDFAQAHDNQGPLPYRINHESDKIGDMSVRTQFNNDQQWTRALKYLLIDLKCLLAWFSTL